MNYYKQLNNDGSYTYLLFSFEPIVNDKMEQITAEEYYNAIAPKSEVEETTNEEIEGQTEICFN